MATGTLTGTTIAATYKSILKVKGGANTVLDADPQLIEDGDGNDSVLGLSTDSVLISGSGTRLDFNTDGSGEYLSGDGTDLTVGSGADIHLTATLDVNIPVNVGLRFGDGGENIETDNTSLTITAATASALVLDANSRISLTNNDLGTANTIFGYLAGDGIQSGGNYNTLLGQESGEAITTGDNNVAVGYQALTAVVTGIKNIAIGHGALTALDGSESRNIAIGYLAGDSLNNEATVDNIFIGDSAGRAGTGADIGNIGIGSGVMQAIGSYAHTGTIGVGFNALAALTSGAGNVAIGYQALDAVTTGAHNIAIGYLAADSVLAGHDSNIAIGTNALGGTHTGTASSQNVAIGGDAMAGAMNDGDNNVAVGYVALQSLTGGGNNVAIGHQAGDAIQAGHNNVAVGQGALTTAIHQDECVAVGQGALAALNDDAADGAVGIGYQALAALTSGAQNTAIGSDVAKLLTTGFHNTVMGYAAFDAADAGENCNVAIGVDAMGACDQGSHATADIEFNVAIGNDALKGGAFGSANLNLTSNVAIGYQAMDGTGSVGGNNCVFVGVDAGGGTWAGTESNFNVGIGHGSMDGAMNAASSNSAVGYRSLGAITSGSANVGIGKDAGLLMNTGGTNTLVGVTAGATIQSGSNNLCVGYGADCSHDGLNAIAIGTGVVAGDNDFSFGKVSNVVTNNFDADADWSRSSDERIKQDIKDDTLGLSFINDLRTVTHRWKPSSEIPKEFNDYNEENQKDTEVVMHGMLAQDVKAALDTAGVDTFAGWSENDDGMQNISREMFVIPLIKAIQELTAKVKALEDAQ